MARLARTMPLGTVQQMQELVAAALNVLFRGQIHFEPGGTETTCRKLTCFPTMVFEASRAGWQPELLPGRQKNLFSQPGRVIVAEAA